MKGAISFCIFTIDDRMKLFADHGFSTDIKITGATKFYIVDLRLHGYREK